MPAEETTAAIVIRARDYSESDRIVALLTREQGKLSGIAKGIRKSRGRFERRLETFSHVMLYFRRRPHGDLVFITRAEAAGLPQYMLDADVAGFALGSYMLELADALTRDGADAAGAYRILCDGLAALNNCSPSSTIRHAFELKLLQWAGYGLEFEHCRVCGAAIAPDSPAPFFAPSRGGIVCVRCRSAIGDGAVRMDSGSALALAEAGRRELGDADMRPAGRDSELALSRFIASIVDRRLRSLEFLNTVL